MPGAGWHHWCLARFHLCSRFLPDWQMALLNRELLIHYVHRSPLLKRRSQRFHNRGTASRAKSPAHLAIATDVFNQTLQLHRPKTRAMACLTDSELNECSVTAIKLPVLVSWWFIVMLIEPVLWTPPERVWSHDAGQATFRSQWEKLGGTHSRRHVSSQIPASWHPAGFICLPSPER